jgi:hypothetical protein
MKKEITIIGTPLKPAEETLLESMRDDIVLGPPESTGTSYPSTEPMKPFIIADPYKHIEFEDYQDGKTRRRERRKRERKERDK